MGFKILFQVGGRGQKFQNSSRYVKLNIFGIKVRFLISPPLRRHFFPKNTNLLVLTNFVSLRGPAQIYTTRRKAPSLGIDGWMDGWDGMGQDGISKVFLNFPSDLTTPDCKVYTKLILPNLLCPSENKYKKKYNKK